MSLPFVEAAEQNKLAIHAVIEPWLQGEALEIGSGTGQHAVYFAARAPAMTWQTSDLEASLPGIAARIDAAGLANLPPPILLDVRGAWPARRYDFIFSANSFHIMDRDMVAACIAGVGECLKPGAVFAVYGPFNYGGAYTSDSNASFDRMLRLRDPSSGLKDFEWITQLAGAAGLELLEDAEMPHNNRTLVWKKRTY
jgi:cyclopropane fatty-acyl-phospholipid synthase-like methyltransferase